jgi:3-methyladenine DNA glycosylase Tag
MHTPKCQPQIPSSLTQLCFCFGIMCELAWSSDEAYVAYHDEEWGVPVHDDKLLFELLVLQGAQAELSQPRILALRENFR